MVGDRIIRASWTSTVVFAVPAIVTTANSKHATEILSAVISVVLFVAGCVVFLAAYGKAISRSRTEEIAVAGVYLMMGGSG